MPPGSSTPRWLTLLGCVLATAGALALAGCGSDGAATAESSPPTQPKQQGIATGAGVGKPCPSQVNAFLESLDTLRHQLAVGLSYEQYAAKIKHLGGDYDALPIDHLTIACLSTTGTPAERAFNKYVDAANAWGECLADAPCGAAAIEPVLQHKWRLASQFLSEAG